METMGLGQRGSGSDDKDPRAVARAEVGEAGGKQDHGTQWWPWQWRRVPLVLVAASRRHCRGRSSG
ncbi:hypothetical protein E2562_023795 [Oryza meyeriana var. granulata]|uniref:Uncharacterized protein n=1 Tax=Oryza meyeriana var. granulata TaxID=110450 RepID=A0A6G1C8B4_9ORYZ|nr:hypothetical protein E2562_023795 [Oryza meyeriana var. granulata]